MTDSVYMQDPTDKQPSIAFEVILDKHSVYILIAFKLLMKAWVNLWRNEAIGNKIKYKIAHYQNHKMYSIILRFGCEFFSKQL